MGILIQMARIALAIVAGFIAGWLLFFVIGLRFLPPGLLVPGCMVAAWFLLPRLFPAFKTQPKAAGSGPTTLQVNGQPFHATHHAKNVAINATTGHVWFRDTKGKEWILASGDIRSWNHEWTDRSNGHGMVAHNDNYLVITTNNLDHPTHRIRMGGHFKHELAKEWHARLTAMLKS
jgi:hypothetical protein